MARAALREWQARQRLAEEKAPRGASQPPLKPAARLARPAPPARRGSPPRGTGALLQRGTEHELPSNHPSSLLHLAGTAAERSSGPGAQSLIGAGAIVEASPDGSHEGMLFLSAPSAPPPGLRTKSSESTGARPSIPLSSLMR
mmetsp:Transcript_120986/g.347615  ORF Transcript_120986/g.347615 Transcript_120986/m.347615 type:complete len:143 (+) Transcript_120986:150-578(+)